MTGNEKPANDTDTAPEDAAEAQKPEAEAEQKPAAEQGHEVVNEYDQSAAAAAYARTQGTAPRDPAAADDAPNQGGANEGRAAEGGAPDEGGAGAEGDTIAALAAAEAALLEENKSLREQVLRAHAEMENLRRRTAREKEDAAKYAISKFAKDLLTVADNMQRALQAIPEGGAADSPLLQTLADGVAAVDRELTTVLERHGVRRVEAQGAPFDANVHEAVMEQPTADVSPGHVAQVFQTGYTLNDRLLRPAMVAVAKAP